VVGATSREEFLVLDKYLDIKYSVGTALQYTALSDVSLRGISVCLYVCLFFVALPVCLLALVDVASGRPRHCRSE